MTAPDLTAPYGPEDDTSAAGLRVVRGWFVDAAERAARWEPAPCPEMVEAIGRVAAMERGQQ